MKGSKQKPEGVYVVDLERAGGNMQGIRSSNCGSSTIVDFGFNTDELEVDYSEIMLSIGLDELYF